MPQWFRSVNSFQTVLRTSFVIVLVSATLGIWSFGGHYVSTRFRNSETQAVVFEDPQNVLAPPPSLSSFTRVSLLSKSLFPDQGHSAQNPWLQHNHKSMRSLFRCLELDRCGPNQDKVIILGSFHFRGHVLGWVGGEDIWARSTVTALTKLGYTFVYSLNMERTVQLYQMFPHLVRAILLEPPETHECFDDTDNCVLSPHNPDGIPAWKLFSFHFWAHPDNPLGRKWTLTPEDYPTEGKGFAETSYLGYSIEAACRSRPFVEHADRPNQAYVMGKYLSFFTPSRNRVWAPELFEAAGAATGIRFLLGTTYNDTSAPDLPAGFVNLGRLEQQAFLSVVARSRVLIGIGEPATSPTPYDALCLGVPFINPVRNWDRANPSDRSQWAPQHGPLSLLDPPYVYNVFQDDAEGFVEAVKSALANPIDSYVPEPMRMASVERRLRDILETDWRAEAETLLAERVENDEGPLFVI